MNWKYLGYDVLREFHDTMFEGVLTNRNLGEEEKYFKTLKVVGREESEVVDFVGVTLAKQGKKYLLQTFDPSKAPGNGREIKPKDVIPLRPTQTTRVGHRNDVFHLINNHNKIKIGEKQDKTFRELVNSLSTFNHTNDLHYKLFWITVLSSVWQRVYYRVATRPGFGKDSSIQVLNLLGEFSKSVVDPTRAKLEFLSDQNVLAISEVTKSTKSEWEDTQQFLLDCGDFKPQTEKRSRSFQGVEETLDIKDLSILLFYNDVLSYSSLDKYFDYKADENVKDRFPALHFAGKLDDNHFDELAAMDIPEFVEENFDDMKSLLYSYTYWKNNFREHVSGYEYDLSGHGLSGRAKRSLRATMQLIDLYSDSQAEYKYFCDEFMDCVKDYERQFMFIDAYNEALEQKSGEQRVEYENKMRETQTFKERLKKLKDGFKSENLNAWD
jgi:hypothetical protein